MNGLKLYEVSTKETITRIYAVTAESHEEAFDNYRKGEVVKETKDREYADIVRKAGE